jgi:hypothetical protein
MTPEEKALEIYSLANLYTHGYVGSSMLSNTEFVDVKEDRTKNLSLSILSLIINEWEREYGRTAKQKYWEQVKEEINKL